MVDEGGVDEGLFARPRTDDEFGTGDDILDFESTIDLESNKDDGQNTTRRMKMDRTT